MHPSKTSYSLLMIARLRRRTCLLNSPLCADPEFAIRVGRRIRFQNHREQTSTICDGKADAVQVQFFRYSGDRAWVWRCQKYSILKLCRVTIACGVCINSDRALQHSRQHIRGADDERVLNVRAA